MLFCTVQIYFPMDARPMAAALLSCCDALLPAGHPAKARYRKVTISARVQVDPGAKVVALVPVVTPVSTAQSTASAFTSVKPAGGSAGTARVLPHEVHRHQAGTGITGRKIAEVLDHVLLRRPLGGFKAILLRRHVPDSVQILGLRGAGGRHRKVMISPRVHCRLGEKVFAPVPAVIPCSTAH